MIVQTTSQSPSQVEAEVLAFGVFDEDQVAPSSLQGTPLGQMVARLIASKDLARSVGDVSPLLGLTSASSGMAAASLMVFGLGKREKFDAGSAFSAGVALGKKLAGRSRDKVAVVVPSGADDKMITSALVEGLVVATRGCDIRKAESTRHPFSTLIVVGPEGLEESSTRGQIVGEAVNLARELANLPPAEKSPTALAAKAREAGEAAGLTVTVWDKVKIELERFGGLIGVAAGSEEPPAFVILEHKLGGNAPTLALVGKGVTFDSGGLSLKPSASMEDMKSDMTGAAVVLATMQAVARLGLKVNVIGYLAITENMINGRAMRLGDVLTMRNGKTVEVLNTDAEGRLILADALAYAAESSPARILDLATLTGACLVALGTKVAGLFTNDDAFEVDVKSAAKSSGERVWRLPLDDDYLDLIKSQVADLKNVGGKWGGAITAAKFLEQFVGGRPWVHLDIAGPSWSDSDSSTRDAGGTGCFVRTLVAMIEQSAGAST